MIERDLPKRMRLMCAHLRKLIHADVGGSAPNATWHSPAMLLQNCDPFVVACESTMNDIHADEVDYRAGCPISIMTDRRRGFGVLVQLCLKVATC